MAAHDQAAIADAELELVLRALRHRRGAGKVSRLEGDTLAHVEPVGAGNVRAPGIAIKRGVEMDVALDEGRHDKLAIKVDDGGVDGAGGNGGEISRRRLAGWRDGAKAVAGDEEIRQRPIGQLRVAENRLFAQNRPLAHGRHLS